MSLEEDHRPLLAAGFTLWRTTNQIANSPDFNPIQKAFSKLKALLRKAAERSVDALWDRIGALLNQFPGAECANYFAAAGCDPL